MDNPKYEVTPKVVPANRVTEIRIRPRFAHSSFKGGKGVSAHYVRDDAGAFEPLTFTMEDGTIVVRRRFEGEREHDIRIVHKDKNNVESIFGDFQVYSLEPDLFALRPFKGDFHIHSAFSDGRESPAYVAASCRRVGMDFMALTDHRAYEPSLEAIAAMRELPTDLRCYPGEEVHPPDNPVHIINFGGSFSVNDLFTKKKNACRAEVRKLEKRLPRLSPATRFEVASSEWCFQKIREAGGVSIYCHPYWKPNERYYVSGETNDAIMERQQYDALEVIGGFYRHQMESNALAVARYQEERAGGKKIPVVGVSDAHGCDRDLFGWYYTIVMARSNDFPDLADGIRSLNSVAVEAVPGEFPRLVGPFRLVKFTYFLLREYFPLHDRLCEQEGRLLIEHLAGDGEAVRRLADLQGQVSALLERLWA